jgi:hypothetical protein
MIGKFFTFFPGGPAPRPPVARFARTFVCFGPSHYSIPYLVTIGKFFTFFPGGSEGVAPLPLPGRAYLPAAEHSSFVPCG